MCAHIDKKFNSQLFIKAATAKAMTSTGVTFSKKH